MRCFLCNRYIDSHNASDVKDNACNRCFPDYGGGVEEVSLVDTPSKPLVESSTPNHHAKKVKR